MKSDGIMDAVSKEQQRGLESTCSVSSDGGKRMHDRATATTTRGWCDRTEQMAVGCDGGSRGWARVCAEEIDGLGERFRRG
ncbi:hypothetical protein M0R45_038424 [Rubus argutus]|uniref:Uncharacterized protein n=1 Tax=Rubus argutus TaxID=59490 RepID=A0AAW1W579_RUBAR